MLNLHLSHIEIRMIVNYFKFIDSKNVTRCACVVDGQPFYRSSGTSSGLDGAWLPFKKFDKDRGFTGQICKLDVAYDSIDRVDTEYDSADRADTEADSSDKKVDIFEYFPPSVALALQTWQSEDRKNNNWGRFGNMKCLLISCMLSDEASIPEGIRKAVLDYVGEHNYKNSYLWARPTIFDCGYMLKTRKMNNDTIEECNAKLSQLGAVIPEEVPLEQLNYSDLNQPQPSVPHYPAVLEPSGSLQQFIDRIPSLTTQAMRFCGRNIRGEPSTPQASTNVDNPIRDDQQGGPLH